MNNIVLMQESYGKDNPCNILLRPDLIKRFVESGTVTTIYIPHDEVEVPLALKCYIKFCDKRRISFKLEDRHTVLVDTILPNHLRFRYHFDDVTSVLGFRSSEDDRYRGRRIGVVETFLDREVLEGIEPERPRLPRWSRSFPD